MKLMLPISSPVRSRPRTSTLSGNAWLMWLTAISRSISDSIAAWSAPARGEARRLVRGRLELVVERLEPRLGPSSARERELISRSASHEFFGSSGPWR